MKDVFISLLVAAIFLASCETTQTKSKESDSGNQNVIKLDTIQSCCQVNSKSRFMLTTDTVKKAAITQGAKGMVFIEGGTFNMGADNNQARPDEFPKHPVQVGGFWMDENEVTNAQFKKFVDETGYVTVAEKDVDWNVLKTQLPPGTPKPADSLLAAGSMVFTPPTYSVPLNDYSQWWTWTTGASWKHPKGPGSSIEGIESHPVVHICYHDAVAYAKWAGKRLPTEAEWEYAARGGLDDNIYPWGNEHIEKGLPKANSWQGNFPNMNTQTDGFFTTSPVKSYAPNGYGLYDMAGNVWEWTQDWYDANYYQTLPTNKISINPKGPQKTANSRNDLEESKVIKGGSFLCNDSYCSSYRVAARMAGEIYTGMSHTGFRCVKNVE
jgi:formylglycine-generating enzyme required for sulfatase activity